MHFLRIKTFSMCLCECVCCWQRDSWSKIWIDLIQVHHWPNSNLCFSRWQILYVFRGFHINIWSRLKTFFFIYISDKDTQQSTVVDTAHQWYKIHLCYFLIYNTFTSIQKSWFILILCTIIFVVYCIINELGRVLRKTLLKI